MSLESMRITVVDVENTVQKTEKGKLDGSPFNPDNYLVSVGLAHIDMTTGNIEPEYLFFKHDEFDGDASKSAMRLKEVLSTSQMLIGHNLKHDLHWLRESGFHIDSHMHYCTMIGEYILSRGRKWPLSLKETAIRRNITLKKSELVDGLFKSGTGFESMPLEVVEEYGIADCVSCADLFLAQVKDYSTNEGKGLRSTRNMMNEMLMVLLDMERNGINIDLEELDKVEVEFTKEKEEIEAKIRDIVSEVMGDIPVNLNSPAQLSEVIYSRKVLDKNEWRKTFNIGLDASGRPLRRPYMNDREFAINVKTNTDVLYRKQAECCMGCNGEGSFQKVRKDGKPYKNRTKCPSCGGTGLIYLNTDRIAGLKLKPSGVSMVSANGFVTDKTSIDYLIKQAGLKNNTTAILFLESIRRLNAISTYLNSFCGGIKRNTRQDGLLHTTFNQCITATGRLSSSDPNFQNQPRGGTFPVRKAVVSRFEGGEIMEADFSGLEFRVAGELSRDPQIIADILEGKDVHKQTAAIINQCDISEVTKDMRQGAKAYTFAPLYGGKGGGEPLHVRNYFVEYFNIYEGLAEWHDKLRSQVLNEGYMTLPSGRQLAWDNVQRMQNGSVTYATQIVNYPVQSFATADIVPLACIRAHKAMKRRPDLKSLIVLTVHDSVVVDIYPGEVDEVKNILVNAMEGVADELKHRYSYDMALPLAIEIKSGSNWLNGKVIYE